MTRNTYWLLGILVVLALAAFLLLQKPGEQSVLPEEGELFAEIDSATVEEIEIQSPTASVALTKKGSEWFIDRPVQYRADQNKVVSFIGKLKSLRIGAVVSSNPEKRSLFHVDSSGTVVRVRGKGTSLSFIVGKTGPSFSEVYLRREESPDVVTADASVSFDIRRAPHDWRDHTVVSMPRESITRIEFRYGDTTFVVALKDSVWMVGTSAGNVQAITSLLSSLSSLQCDDFLDVPPAPAPKLIATLSFNGIQIRFSQVRGRDSYYVQTSMSPQWFELRSWRAHQVLKRKKDLVR